MKIFTLTLSYSLSHGFILNQRKRAEENSLLATLLFEYQARMAKKRAEKEARRATVLSEWERTCSLPQSEEVGSVRVWYSCSLVCLT